MHQLPPVITHDALIEGAPVDSVICAAASSMIRSISLTAAVLLKERPTPESWIVPMSRLLQAT